MICVVLKHKEDPWFLDVQKESVQKIYETNLLVAGYEDAEYETDITLIYKKNCKSFPFAMLEGVRQIVEIYPTDLLFFEGDMIPNKKMNLIPTVRQYFGTAWPSVLYTGNKEVDTSGIWDAWQKMNVIFEHFERMPFEREESTFERIGENSEFLHPQAGCRGRKSVKRISDFKDFVRQCQFD